MPSTTTFPLWVCLTPTLSWKHLGKQEGNQSRASSGEGVPVPHLCPCMVPSPTLPVPTLEGQVLGFLPQQGLIKNGESSLQDLVQKLGVHQELPWLGKQGPGYDFSSVALNFIAKKGLWTEKSLWRCPRLSEKVLRTQLGWEEPSPSAWLTSMARLVWLL